MFELEGLRDPLFLTLYVVAGCLALVAAVYLLFRRRNAVAPDVGSSLVLRRWTAAFLLAAALSHVWWLVLGTVWMTDDHLMRTITVILLDHSTLVPLVMAVLLSMLQDRRRPIWLWLLVQVPVEITTMEGHGMGIIRNYQGGRFHYWFGAAWSEFDVRSQAEWQSRIVDFMQAVRQPLIIGTPNQ